MPQSIQTSSLLTYGAIALAVAAAVWIGFHILTIVIVLVALIAVAYFVPPLNTLIFGTLLGLNLSPTQLYQDALGEAEAIVTKFEQAAESLFDEVILHENNAAAEAKLARAKKALSEHATQCAANHKALIA